MRLFLMITICFTIAAHAAQRVDKEAQAKEAERTQLQTSLETMRDSLERLIARQYSFKQQTITQRETDKEELDRYAEEQARLMNELSRVKEERLSREQMIGEERATLTRKQEEWTALRSQLTDLFQKDADAVVEAFPLDKEMRRAGLERVRSGFANTGSCATALTSFVDYRLHWFTAGDSTGMQVAVVAPEEGAPLQLSIARFGNILAYGIDSAGSGCYYLRQTGRLGAAKYSVDKINDPQLALGLAERLTAWKRTGRIDGPLPVEMMQNDQTRMLIAGKKLSAWESLFGSFVKGGWVMIPMLLLPFWVLYLAIGKIIQFTVRGGRMKRQFRTAMAYINKGEFDAAQTFVSGCRKGSIARMVTGCIEHKPQGRAAGQRTMYEFLQLEIPQLNRGLNTLAVIAGAAPLLGLLGTISGMITLFAAVTQFGTGDPKFLAGGISEALITAKTGLAIAIPVLFIHDLLRGAKDRLIADMEKNGIALLNAIYPEE